MQGRQLAFDCLYQLFRKQKTVWKTGPQWPIESFVATSEADDAREAGLGSALVQTSLQHWLTLGYLVDQRLKKPGVTLEPAVQAGLFLGAVQLVYFSRMPQHAAVNETIKLTADYLKKQYKEDGKKIGPNQLKGAKGLINAVLRRVGESVDWHAEDIEWTIDSKRLPHDQGTVIMLEDVLPDPKKDLEFYLKVSCSLPPYLIRSWETLVEMRVTRGEIEPKQKRQALSALCRSASRIPPVVFSKPKLTEDEAIAGWQALVEAQVVEPHAADGHFVTSAINRLQPYLASGQSVIQDVTSSKPVTATEGLEPAFIIDLCAGRGTKSVQLLKQHPEATVLACEVNAARLKDLAALSNEPYTDGRLAFCHVDELSDWMAKHEKTHADLISADVPCSNSGVFARRPEARYRFNKETLEPLNELQMTILENALKWLAPEGHLLFSTCSIQNWENEALTQWLSSEGLETVDEHTSLPDGFGASYVDGGYYALLRKS